MKAGGALALAVVAGFVAGFLWGAGTRDALSGRTRTRYSGGVLTVEVDAGGALTDSITTLPARLLG